jgi:hypothetical protein
MPSCRTTSWSFAWLGGHTQRRQFETVHVSCGRGPPGVLQLLISIEHNPQWHTIVQSIVEASPQLLKPLRYHLCEGSAYWQHGYGQTREENPMGLDNYFCPGQEVNVASLLDITSGNNPTYLVVSLLDRNEYTAASNGNTGTMRRHANTPTQHTAILTT